MQYPLVYLARNHNPDGFGYGRWQGGAGSYRLYTVFGSQDLTIDYKPYGGIPTGAFGLFGGYPAGSGVIRALFPNETLLDRLEAGERYPVLPAEVLAGGWGEVWCPPGTPERVPIPEGWLLSDFVAGGGGFGDPLDREPERVAADVRGRRLSARIANLIYGVVVDAAGTLDAGATTARRDAIRAERRAAETAAGQTSGIGDAASASWRPALRFHLHLAVVTDGARYAVQCQRCGHLFCDLADNYKRYAPRRRRPLEELAGGPLPSGEPYQGYLLEYACPGCGTLLQVDLVCPSLDDDTPLHDVRPDRAWLARRGDAAPAAR
jgi:N-methylhydantoinase B